MLKFLLSGVYIVLAVITHAQSVVVTNTQTPSQLVNSVLLGMGVTASNITINGNPVTANSVQGNVASFTNTNPSFPISSGLLLTTGNAIAAQGPNNSTNLSNNIPPTPNVASDPHLNILAAGNITNGVVLEFDFIPTGDTLNFRYLFGSEEYPEFAPPNSSGFNDAFGFFLWGPGITGPYVLAGYPNGANIATILGGTPVTINNVNPSVNSMFYVNNMTGATYGTGIQYDGTTVLLTASASVQCNQTYHIKLAISNVSDNGWDSGVFLEANSFSSNVVDVAVATVSGDTTIVEGCNFADIIFTRPEGNMLDTLSIIYTLGGTAIEGVDYNNLIDTIVFLPGVDTVILNLTPIQDGSIEGIESIIISVNIINPCGDTITSSGIIYVWDGPTIDALISTNANCNPIGSVSVAIVDPIFPASYSWTGPGGLSSNTATWLNLNQGFYYVTVTQSGCSVTDSIEVFLDEPPFANFSYALPLSNCQPVTYSFVNNSLNATSYNWTFGDGNISSENNPSNSYSNQAFGTYIVQLIAFIDPLCVSDTTITINLDVCGCMDPSVENYEPLANVDDGSCVYPYPEVFAPNVFTPNSDADNPTFFLSGNNIVSLELTILNRWGQVVFTKNGNNLDGTNPSWPSWDGKINGIQAVEGIYFYSYKATGITNQVVEGHGFLHLVSE
jgi:gliding motility-associated-like protein